MKIIEKIKKRIRYRSSPNEITLSEVKSMIKNCYNMVLIDVRSPQEYREGHLKTAISLPLYDLNKKVKNIIPNPNTLIVVYCQYGIRSRKAVKVLKNIGYNNVYNITGGVEGNI